MPTILAIDTSADLASCALLSGERLFERAASGVRTHSQSILPMVQELLAQAGLTLGQLDAIAFGAGPGSFTGVRTACGVAQGLAFGANLPVLPLNTLHAMAQACRTQTGATDVLVALDARMGEVYWAQYSFDGKWHTVIAPTLAQPGAVAPQLVPGLVACGNGFSAYAEAFAEQSFATGAQSEIMPHARELAQLAVTALADGQAVPAAQAQPLYLRNKVAYTSAERAVINAAKALA